MKVSVYCLVFNHELYLRDALEGFVTQKTNFDYEVLVHDDASTDGSRAIIEEYAEKYPDIIKPIYQEENQHSKGIPIIQTHIAPRITGEYIAICEGDDYWTDPDKLQLQVDFLDSHPEHTACVHNTLLHDLRTGKKKQMYQHDHDVDISFLEAVQGGSCCWHTSSVMYRREYIFNRPEFFQKAKGFGDYPLAIYLTLSGKVRFLNRCMSVYRLGTVSSWTKSHAVTLRKNAVFHHHVIDMLNSVNSYTNGQYAQVLQDLALKHEYQALYFEEQYAKIRKAPYSKFYKQESLSFRLKTYLKQFLNKPYQLYRKLIYK